MEKELALNKESASKLLSIPIGGLRNRYNLSCWIRLSLANQSAAKFSSLGIYLSGEGRDEYKVPSVLNRM